MKKKNYVTRGLALKISLFAGMLALSGVANADQFGVQLAGGVADHHVHKLDLGVVWDPGLNWWYIGDWHFTVVGEGHVAWWHTDEGNVHENVGEIGFTPVLRFIKGSGAIRPYFEAGAGVRLLTSPTISSHYSLGSAFQFADMVGVGAQFGNRQQYQVGYRFQHVSNASIKEPNPGINFSQLYLQYNF
ncbi:acyloxyacyl hydrolase [Paraburkholderia sp.]|uniref:acyloxyacyl hydrolase n=1 Tax=Paraburkholderia sp. TaxID=1926495 RepID=UPI003D6F856C